MSYAAHPPQERFWPKVNKTNGCWLWLGSTNPNGYGRFFIKRGLPALLAHRYSYELTNGPIPEGMQVDHLCRCRECVNPSHLELVSPRVNTLRGNSPSAISVRLGQCSRGHKRNSANSYVSPSTGKRECRQCRRHRRSRPHRHGGKAL